MVPYRVADCLLTLKAQWQTAHPGAANPGFIGDAAHATRESDHNPWVDDPTSLVNVVTAGDFYHQPAIGADAYDLAEALKQAKDRRVKYVISRYRIWSLARDDEGWRPYGGSNPHTGHTHVSVTSSYPLYDVQTPWVITTAEEFDMDETKLRAIIADELNKQDRELWILGTGKSQVIDPIKRLETRVEAIETKINAALIQDQA